MNAQRALRLAPLLVLVLAAPVSAQSFLSGDWANFYHEDQPERGPGPALGDFTGLPINAAGRQYADSWDASRLTLPEHQCRAHVSPYIYRGPIRVRITEDIDPGTQTVIAIRHFLSTYAQERVIWLDGREHPACGGAAYVDGILDRRVAGTHAQGADHAHQAGVASPQRLPMSDKTTMTEYFFRHGNILTQLSIVEDPVFLEEPLVKTTNLMLDVGGPNAFQAWLFCQADDEVPGRDPAYVPHYLPGQNPYLTEFAAQHGLPVEPTRGGAQTMYPEYMQKVKAMPIAPAPRRQGR